MSRKKICNYDCFHCPYPDCIAKPNVLTDWERAILKGAHGWWRSEAIVDAVARMEKAGINQSTAYQRLGINHKDFCTARSRYKYKRTKKSH